jgi:hypothetical protein
MSFDLTNKNISDTFQNLLQKTGSEGHLYDLEGNLVDNLTIGGTLTAHSYVTSESIVNTSSGSTTFGNTVDDSHTFIGNITASGNISGSLTTNLTIGGDISANSGSFNYITASIVDVNADTIRFGGEPFTKANVVALKAGKTLKPVSAGRSFPGVVAGDGNFEGNITASGNISSSGHLYVGENAYFDHTAVGAATENIFNVANQGTDRFIIQANGAVGIGNSSPTKKLVVAGDISASGNFYSQGNIESVTHITASGHISASKFVGDGSELTGLTSAAISSYTNNGNNRVVTSVNGSTVNSEANLTFDGTSLNVNGELTSSKILVNAPNSTDDFFLLKSGSLTSLKVNGEGVLQLGSFSFTPTAVKGGLYYDNGDDEFYAGKQN